MKKANWEEIIDLAIKNNSPLMLEFFKNGKIIRQLIPITEVKKFKKLQGGEGK